MPVVAPAELRSFAQRLMVAAGMDPTEAEAAAEVLVWCDLVGRDTQGVWRLPVLLERLERGLIRSPAKIRVERASGSLLLIDGDDGLGYCVARFAMEKAIDVARQTGAGIAAVRRSNHLGAGAYYVQLAARQGLIGLALSNSFPKVAPHGGLEPLLGTNPIAFGCPRRDGRSVLVDFATAASAGSTLRKQHEAGGPLPQASIVAQAGDGKETVILSDGVKGYGLALLVEVLAGVLSGAGVSRGVGSMYSEWSRPANVGHFFLALDVERFLPLDLFLERLESLLSTLETSPAQPGVARVLVPGSARWARAAEQADGIRLEDETAARLATLARSRDVHPPWERDAQPAE